MALQPAKRTGLEQELHTLVERLCAAPPGGRAQVFAELVQQACLVMQLEQEAGLRAPEPDLNGTVPQVAEPEPVPLAEPAAELAPSLVLEGPFVRLEEGGKLFHAEGVHDIHEADVAALRLHHGDIIRAESTPDGGFQYGIVCPGPLVNANAHTVVGPVMEANDDVALLCLHNGDRIVVPTREIEAQGCDRLAVLTVSYLRNDRWGTKFAGRVVKVHPTEQKPAAQTPKCQRRKRPEVPDSDSECRPANLPQFAPIAGRRPVIAVVGGQPQLRARFHAILEEYGAVYRSLPYSPSDNQIETAVKASDLIIGVPQCCRTGHWESVKKYARSLGRLWLPARSHNESGFRQQVETDLIPQWRRWVEGTGRD